MSQRFYCLNGVDDVNLKHVFLNSFLESLGNEAYRALEARNKKFLAEFKRTGKRLRTACDDKYLQIKCKDKCHFARNCPDKKRSQALIQDLNQAEPVDVSDLKSLYSLDDEPNDSVLCWIAYSDFSSDDDSDTDSLKTDSDFGVHMINPIPHVLLIQEDPPLPLAKVHLITDAYAKPIPVIAFFDTSSSVSSLKPNILPDHYWKPHHQNFMAANGENFVIDKISVPINICHPGMNPDHYQLAKDECEQLVSQGIIEPTTSPWACEAFYVNKRSEQLRGKLRLNLVDAKVLSKFELKYGFWQLGIKPEDRLKTAFCIPDHHYQWKSHAELLSKFYSLVTKYAIMLSEKKMGVGVTTIQFLGMEIPDGKYQPQPHVA
ncbi:hypothetical protein Tco_0708135 [Tanacetum coccineum]